MKPTSALLFMLITCSIPQQIWGQEKKQTDAFDVRMEWITQTKSTLLAIDPSEYTDTTRYFTWDNEGQIAHRYFFRKSGILKFSSGDWIYVVLHSGHDDPSGSNAEAIGDLSLAIDQDGNFYYNQGHICGEIGFEALSDKKINTSKGFFKHFKDDQDGSSWFPLLEDEAPSSGHHH